MASALYNQGKFEEAAQTLESIDVKTVDNIPYLYHNLGNALLKSGKVRESVEAYKKALKKSPSDMDVKYNLSYALEKLSNQENSNSQDGDKKNEDKQKQGHGGGKNKPNKQQKNQNKGDKKKTSDSNKSEEEKKKQNNKQAEKSKKKEEKQENSQLLNAIELMERDARKKAKSNIVNDIVIQKDW